MVQNARLASKITSWAIDVMTEEQESKRRTEGLLIQNYSLKGLGVRSVRQLLSTEGFTTIDQIASTDNTVLEVYRRIRSKISKKI